ncbi:MAG: right-handed parallel beta-helix repeat-containing protein [Prevotella sp.]|nr:right-handed parallel beta-helix repeat-containing protein [Prevotella sp.]
MKKMVSLFVSIVALFTLFISGTLIASASSNTTTITVTADEINSTSAYTAIQSALSTAQSKASSSSPYTVMVEKGSYSLDYSLRIYSYTTLDLTGVTLTQTATKTGTVTTTDEEGNTLSEKAIVENNSNMLKVGDSDDQHTGYYYKNITVLGGTFDENGNGNTCLKIAHASNVTVQDCNFKNVTNGHFMEVAGTNGLTIENCTYKNQLLTVDTSVADHDSLTYEAIQLDILEENHFNGYACEDLPNKNITVDGCTFDTVPRGVGSHTAILNDPMDGLTITNNTFKNISSCAIHVIGCKNLTISNNTIKDGPRGIAVYSYQINGTFLPSTLASEGGVSTDVSSSYQTPSSSNIVIKNNSITVSGKDSYATYEKGAIRVEGLTLSSAKKTYGDKIPAGKYYLTGITISGNTIKTDAHGIRLVFAKKATINSNKNITYTGTNYGSSNSNKYYGISLTENSSAVSINKNIVNPNSSSKMFYRDVYILNSSATEVSGNKFYTCSDNGISLEGATVSTISSNTVNNATTNGIFVYSGSTVKNLKSNTVRDSGKYGISIENSTTTTIKSNTVARSAVNDIYVSKSSKVTNLKSNKCKNAAKYGISIEGATATTVSSNTVTSSANTGIRVSYSAKVTNLKSNTVKNVKGHGIDVEDATCTNITSNTISKCLKNGINVSSNGTTRVKKIASNTIKNSATYGISIQSIKCAMSVSKNNISAGGGAYMLYYNPKSTKYTATISNNTIVGKSSKKGVGLQITSGSVSIKSNSIKKCAKGHVLSSNAKGSIYSNTLKSNGNNYIVIGSTNYSLCSSPKLSVASKTKTSIKTKWNKVSRASGYAIYRSSSKNGSYSKIKTISSNKTTTYNNSGLKSNKKYYYKAMAYRKVGNFKLYSDYGNILSVTTKK